MSIRGMAAAAAAALVLLAGCGGTPEPSPEMERAEIARLVLDDQWYDLTPTEQDAVCRNWRHTGPLGVHEFFQDADLDQTQITEADVTGHLWEKCGVPG
jgi:hypothetical protein